MVVNEFILLDEQETEKLALVGGLLSISHTMIQLVNLVEGTHKKKFQ